MKLRKKFLKPDIIRKKIAQKVFLLILAFSAFFLSLNTVFAAPKINNQELIPSFPITLNDSNEETFVSETQTGDKSFSALGIDWVQDKPLGTELLLEARFKDLDDKWSEWYEITEEIDFKDSSEKSSLSGFIAVNLSKEFQYRVTLKTYNDKISPKLISINFTYLYPDKGAEGESSFLQKINDTKKTLVANILSGSGLKVITRSEWGADESLRYFGEGEEITPDTTPLKAYDDGTEMVYKVKKDNSGKEYLWPLEYSNKIKKIVIHHTASAANLDDPKTAIRNIYHWHAVGRGWGDIGYNYIIDTEGNIYEGRAGGERVVGGHAKDYNVGSIGIAVLGNYENSEPSQKVMDSLIKLIQDKVEKHGIDPEGKSLFRGSEIANILGHIDVGKTSCPGSHLYSKIENIRNEISGNLANRKLTKKYDYIEMYGGDLISLSAGETKKVKIKIKNKGKSSLTDSTYLTYAFDNKEKENENALTLKEITGSKLSYLKEKTVASFGTGSFEFEITAKSSAGLYYVNLYPVFNGKVKALIPFKFPVYIEESTGSFELIGITNQNKYLKPGQTFKSEIKLKNTGNMAWAKEGENRIVIGTDKPSDRESNFFEKPKNRVGYLKESKVEPGEIGTFLMNFKAPKQGTAFVEYFRPVLNNGTYLSGEDIVYNINLIIEDYKAELLSQSTDISFKKNETKEIWFELKNVGIETWKDTGTNKFTTSYLKSKNLNVSDIKLSKKTITSGNTVKLKAKIKAGVKDGLYYVYFTPKVDKKKILSKSLAFTFNVGEIKGLPQDEEDVDYRPEEMTEENNLIRILITKAVEDTQTITSTKKFSVYAGDLNLYTFSKNSKANVYFKDGKYHLRSDKLDLDVLEYFRFVPAEENGIIEISSYVNKPSDTSKYNDNKFKGVIEARTVDGVLKIINELPLEDYLKGLGELGPDDPKEKHKAIIIAARSYAKYYTDLGRKFSGMPYHLDDDPAHSQKYNGYGLEERADYLVDAVNNTYGEVVTYKGIVVKTPYFSESDGRTRSAYEVWGVTDLPYLQGVDDPYCEGLSLRGHGVGMSGCGAKGAAESGKNYKEILEYYYTDIEVEKIY